MEEVCFIELQPRDFSLESTTVWSFPDRGNWVTHSGQYRGNWSPYVPRNIILRYSNPGDWILDQFLGNGTTIVEAKLLSRNAVGVDIDPQSISISEENVQIENESRSKVFIREGNALRLDFLKEEEIDLICTYPPYVDIIRYSNNIGGDISHLDTESFLIMMEKVAQKSYRVLEKGRICAVVMGDIGKEGQMIPLGFKTIKCFTKCGFQLKEIILKEQHNCKSAEVWERGNSKFLLLVHEYIFIFETQSLFTLSESSSCYSG